ncbi:hypothetical protein WJX82_006529 [Trebouxia sp. C0006]
MAKPKGKDSRKKSATNSSGKKRVASAAFPAENNRDEFFEGSDSEAPSQGEEDEQRVETAPEKRNRIAKEYMQKVNIGLQEQAGSDSEMDEAGVHDSLGEVLKQKAMEASGYMQRKIAHQLELPSLRAASGTNTGTSGRFIRTSKMAVTAVCLSSDDQTAYCVSKDGVIFALDIESGKRSRFDWQHTADHSQTVGTTADWVKRKAQSVGKNALLAIAISFDDRYLVVGGGDKKLHIWDAISHQYIRSLSGTTGHKDVITGLAFRDGTHELFSCGADRAVKLWNLDNMAYVDTLFGHQSEVLAIDILRQERAVSSGNDHTCRVWKIAEESQLIFRSHGMAVDCCKYITGTEWVTGASDGSLAMWSQTKKRPTSVLRRAHGYPRPGLAPFSTQSVASVTGQDPTADGTNGLEDDGPVGPGSVGGDAASWIGAVGVCKGTDLVASGAGDGVVRLWQVADGKVGKVLHELGGLPARGFVNALQFARSGKFLVAGMGQEPRLGRWARDGTAKNGLLIHQLHLRND